MNNDTGTEITQLLRVWDILNMRLVCTEYARCIAVPLIRYTRSRFNPQIYICGKSAKCEFVVSSTMVTVETEEAKFDIGRQKMQINSITGAPIPRCVLLNFNGTDELFHALSELFPNAVRDLPIFVYINTLPPAVLKRARNSGIISFDGTDMVRYGSVTREHDRVQLLSKGAHISDAAEGLARRGFIAIYDNKKTYIDSVDNIRGYKLSLRAATIPVLMHVADAYDLYC